MIPANALFHREWLVRIEGLSNDDLLPLTGTTDALQSSTIDLEFKILRTLRPVPNHAVVKVFNLNKTHRSQLYKRNRPQGANGPVVGINVQVEGGYVGHRSVLFSGDLRSVGTVREGEDFVSTLSLDDGGRAVREARISRSFAAGTPIGDVLLAVCNAIGCGIGNAGNFRTTASILGINQTTLPGTMTFDGNGYKALGRICNSIGVNYSIQSGALLLLPKGKAQRRDAIVLSATTGMLDSPQPAIDSTVSLAHAQIARGKGGATGATFTPKNTGILRVKSLLRPGLVPGAIVQIESEIVPSGAPNYVITEVEYIGQSWSHEWTADMVVRTYEAL